MEAPNFILKVTATDDGGNSNTINVSPTFSESGDNEEDDEDDYE